VVVVIAFIGKRRGRSRATTATSGAGDKPFVAQRAALTFAAAGPSLRGIAMKTPLPAPVLAVVLLAAPWATAAEPKEKAPPAFPTDVRVERSVAYLPADREEKADLYFPRTISPGARLPAMVIIHGGGWNGGQRDGKRELNIGGTLARHGYVGMSIDYKLARGHGAIWPQNLWDCKTAVRWLRKHADRLGLDPDRIGVMGGSAGGHLASMVALTTADDGLDPAKPYGEFSCAVRLCIDLYGIADIATYHDVKMLGKTIAEAPELYRRASPLTYVRPGAVPFLILHGTADTTVNVKQSEVFAAAFAKAGVPHELVIIPGARHTFDLEPPQRDLRPVVLGFLEKHLGPRR
jgi:acetyl esterase/lipase